MSNNKRGRRTRACSARSSRSSGCRPFEIPWVPEPGKHAAFGGLPLPSPPFLCILNIHFRNENGEIGCLHTNVHSVFLRNIHMCCVLRFPRPQVFLKRGSAFRFRISLALSSSISRQGCVDGSVISTDQLISSPGVCCTPSTPGTDGTLSQPYDADLNYRVHDDSRLQVFRRRKSVKKLNAVGV